METAAGQDGKHTVATLADRRVPIPSDPDAAVSLYTLCRAWVRNQPTLPLTANAPPLHGVGAKRENTEQHGLLSILPPILAPTPLEAETVAPSYPLDDFEQREPAEALRKLKDHWAAVRMYHQAVRRAKLSRHKERLQVLLGEPSAIPALQEHHQQQRMEAQLHSQPSQLTSAMQQQALQGAQQQQQLAFAHMHIAALDQGAAASSLPQLPQLPQLAQALTQRQGSGTIGAPASGGVVDKDTVMDVAQASVPGPAAPRAPGVQDPAAHAALIDILHQLGGVPMAQTRTAVHGGALDPMPQGQPQLVMPYTQPLAAEAVQQSESGTAFLQQMQSKQQTHQAADGATLGQTHGDSVANGVDLMALYQQQAMPIQQPAQAEVPQTQDGASVGEGSLGEAAHDDLQSLEAVIGMPQTTGGIANHAGYMDVDTGDTQ